MKISKYPVKHKYSIARLVSDVVSLGFAVMIFSVTTSFIDSYNELLAVMGSDNVNTIIANVDPTFGWRHYLAWIFPALAVLVFIAYLVLCLVSHPFKKYRVTKLTAQRCCDIYTFSVSLCKVPLLMGIFDAMYIFHQRMLGTDQSIFSIQIILDILLIAIITRLGVHRVQAITEPREAPETAEEEPTENAPVKVTITPVKKEEEQ